MEDTGRQGAGGRVPGVRGDAFEDDHLAVGGRPGLPARRAFRGGGQRGRRVGGSQGRSPHFPPARIKHKAMGMETRCFWGEMGKGRKSGR